VERAFVHVDYEDDHDVHEEHKPLYERKEKKQRKTLREMLLLGKKKPSDIENPTTRAS
jgi:hypothetical protein